VYLLVLAPMWGQDVKSSELKTKVVFVCEHGSAKSVIAAAELSRMAKERGLDLSILARGTNPDAEVPKLVRWSEDRRPRHRKFEADEGFRE
jgi:hypothetical protein